jgi:hypothetical protein
VIRVESYSGRFGSLRGQFGALPQWARTIVAIAAIPGLALMALSILAFGVSILALLLLTVPVYSALQKLTGRPRSSQTDTIEVSSPGSRRVEATIIE